MTAKKPSPGAQGANITEKDADRLIASYGRAVPAEKKAALMSKLEAERGAFEKGRSQGTPKKGERGFERG